MDKLHTWYRPEQTIDFGGIVSNRKPKQVIAAAGAALEIHEDFPLVTAEQLYRVHDKKYVGDVLALKKSNGFGHRDQVELTQALAHCGSLLAAAQGVRDLNLQVAFSPSQGFHHAGYDYGGAFCTFNGLALAADELALRGLRTCILDGDAHYGDGTHNILGELPGLAKWVTHVPLSNKLRWSDADLKDPHELVDALDEILRGIGEVDIVLYQAGADAHVDDPYGSGYLTTTTFAIRDWLIFGHFARRGVPVVFNLAGGYQEDNAVVKLHGITIEKALRYCHGTIPNS